MPIGHADFGVRRLRDDATRLRRVRHERGGHRRLDPRRQRHRVGAREDREQRVARRQCRARIVGRDDCDEAIGAVRFIADRTIHFRHRDRRQDLLRERVSILRRHNDIAVEECAAVRTDEYVRLRLPRLGGSRFAAAQQRGLGAIEFGGENAVLVEAAQLAQCRLECSRALPGLRRDIHFEDLQVADESRRAETGLDERCIGLARKFGHPLAGDVRDQRIDQVATLIGFGAILHRRPADQQLD